MYEVFEKLCKLQGITPYRVCKDTGIPTAAISNWKAGRYTPKSGTLQKIAAYFHVSLEYMTTGKDSKESNFIHEGAVLSEEVLSVASELLCRPELLDLMLVLKKKDDGYLSALKNLIIYSDLHR